MKNPELFHRTVKYLIKALLNDTFEYTDCHACAVGNIVAGSLELKVVRHLDFNAFDWFNTEGKQIKEEWGQVFCGGSVENLDYEPGLKQINSTGYSVEQLMQIEKAFGVGSSTWYGEDLYAGVIAVIELLHEIHQEDLIPVLK